METAVVEELASKMDQQAVVKRSKEQCMQQFQCSLRELDDRCANHLHTMADDFSRAWLGVAERIGQAAEAVAGQRRCDKPIAQRNESKPQPHSWAPVPAARHEPYREPRDPGSPAVQTQQHAVQHAQRAQDSEFQEEASAPQIEFAATPSSHTGHTRESSTGSQARDAMVASTLDSEVAALEASVDYTSPKDALKALAPLAPEVHQDSEGEPEAQHEPHEPQQQQHQQHHSHHGHHGHHGHHSRDSPHCLQFEFDERVQKLGFEVVWADRPCVGSVVPNGEAERVGLVAGAVITEMNGISTLNKSRDELMPLLKLRPLRLNADVPA